MAKQGKNTYNVNLDPAVLKVEFPCHIDIRDSVKYKQVMKSYNLGPNGSILTSLNLFAAQFDQVIGLMQAKASTLE
jgi:GPN-loop GTPase